MSDPNDHEIRQLVDQTEDRHALEGLRDRYTQRLHRRSDDFAATDGLRLVTAKLRRIPPASPVVTTSS